jgi:ferritin
MEELIIMLKDKVLNSLNAQINAELFSEYLYLSMAAWFESQNWLGFAKWMKVQAGEERGHAMKFYDYVHLSGGHVKLDAIKAPTTTWGSPLAAFEDAYRHEQSITAKIHDLVKLAAAEGDTATGIMLQWFVSEQVEEEANASQIVAKLKLIGENTNGLFMVDHELGKRE